jgi:ACS family D-galactonate transporter-like MFS transporter
MNEPPFATGQPPDTPPRLRKEREDAGFSRGLHQRSEGDQRVTWVRWRIVLLLMAFSFLNYVNRQSLPVAADERIIPEEGVDPAAMGTVYTAFLIAYTLFMLPGGWAVDRFGPRRALIGIGFGSAAFVALSGLWGQAMLAAGGGLAAIGISRALLGIFSAPIYPACGRMVAEWIPLRHRSLATGLIVGSAPLGIAFSFVGVGRLIELVDWPTAFAILGLITGTVGLVWMVYSRDHPEQHPSISPAELALIRSDGPPRDHNPSLQHSESSSPDVVPAGPPPSATTITIQTPVWKRILANRSIMAITLSYTTLGYFEYLLFYWMHYYFEHVLQLGKEESRLYAMIPPLAMVVGMPLGGWATDRLRVSLGLKWGRRSVAMVGMILGALGLGLATRTQQPFALVCWFSLAWGMVGAADVLFWTTSIELGGRRGGTTGALCNFGSNAVGTVAPWATPRIAQAIDSTPNLPSYLLIFGDGWSTALAIGSLLTLAGAVLWLWIDANQKLE